MISNYKLIEKIVEIDTLVDGLHFERIEAYSLVGSPLSDAPKHPLQFFAYTNCREGDDDPFEGVGWTVTEALKDLKNVLIREARNEMV